MITPPQEFWPVSITGWISLITSISMALAVAIGYGKWLEKLNGMGARVKVLEEAKATYEGREIERTKQMDRLLNHHEDLIRQIGEAKRSAVECQESIELTTERIGLKIDSTQKLVSDMQLDVSQRLMRVETVLKLQPMRDP